LTGTYAALTYMNDTGVDQVFLVTIAPYSRRSLCEYETGEYIVEFRR
jgi:hypothetical protein